VELHLKHRRGSEVLRIAGAGEMLSIQRGTDREIEMELVAAGADGLVLDAGGARHRVRFFREGPVVFLHLRGTVMSFRLEDPDDESGTEETEVSPVLRSPMPGKILEVLTREGASVSAGDPLVRMEAMKMEIDVVAQIGGTVASVSVAAGDLVVPDAELLKIATDTGD
jgi:acetyl/propionyl-CoA carboxylase alpha subunit